MSQNKVGIFASQISGHLWEPAGAYDSLATVTVPSGGVSSIVFSGIPQGYRHLELRFNCIINADLNIRFNGDSSITYPYHYTYGAGGTPVSATDTGFTYGYIGYGGFGGAGATMAGVSTILDYSSTIKFKTLKSINGNDGNTAGGGVMFTSSLWRSTSAINSLTIYSKDSVSLSQHSSFALYGIK